MTQLRSFVAGAYPDAGVSLDVGDSGEDMVPRPQAWYLVARAAEELPATACLCVNHLVSSAPEGQGFRLAGS